MYFIYIIYSPSADKYYVGYTTNIEKRLVNHNTQDKYNKYTRKIDHREFFKMTRISLFVRDDDHRLKSRRRFALLSSRKIKRLPLLKSIWVVSYLFKIYL